MKKIEIIFIIIIFCLAWIFQTSLFDYLDLFDFKNIDYQDQSIIIIPSISMDSEYNPKNTIELYSDWQLYQTLESRLYYGNP